jgi:hypothetical protein
MRENHALGRAGKPRPAKTLSARTASQTTVRTVLSSVAARWRSLQEARRGAWAASAKAARNIPRLGQSGSLSGFLLFTKIDCTLAQFGQEQVDARQQFVLVLSERQPIAWLMVSPCEPERSARLLAALRG